MSKTVASSLALDAAAFLQFGATPAASGQIRATGAFLCRSTGALSLTCDSGAAAVQASAGNVNITATGASSDVVCTAGRNTSDVAANVCFLTGGTGIDIKATTNDVLCTSVARHVSLVAAQDVFLTHGAGRICGIAGSGGAFLRFGNEANASTPTLAAGQALLWVKDNSPNDPYFTDDTNADRKIMTAPAPVTDLASAPAGSVLGNPTSAAASPTYTAPTKGGQVLRGSALHTTTEWAQLAVDSPMWAAGSWYGNAETGAAALTGYSWATTLGSGLRYLTSTANVTPEVLPLAAAATSQSLATSAAPAVTLPALTTDGRPITSGDRAILMLRVPNTTTTVTAPSGFTQLADLSDFFSIVRIYEKVLDGTEGKTVSFALGTARACYARLMIVRGADPAVAGQASTAAAFNFAATTIDPPNFAPSFATAALNTLWVGVLSLRGAAPLSVTAFPSSTTGQDQIYYSAEAWTAASCYRVLASSSWDPSAWTFDSAGNAQRAITLAFAPTSRGLIDAAAGSLFTIGPITLTPGTPGSPDDVTVYAANAPTACRIIRADARISAAIASATLQGRSASAGLGSALTDTFSGATLGPAAITAGLTATTTLSVGGSLYIRRSDAGIGGEIVLTAARL